jgi:hypothetical protein
MISRDVIRTFEEITALHSLAKREEFRCIRHDGALLVEYPYAEPKKELVGYDPLNGNLAIYHESITIRKLSFIYTAPYVSHTGEEVYLAVDPNKEHEIYDALLLSFKDPEHDH